MEKFFPLLLIMCFNMIGPQSYSQDPIEVSDPRLQMVGNTIHISYDILNSTPSQEFNVELSVRDDQGNTLDPGALSGDVGERVNGGNDKHIEWDLDADRIEINADIFIKVFVKAIPPPDPEVSFTEKKEGAEEKTPDNPLKEIPGDETVRDTEDKSMPGSIDGVQFSRAGLIGQSVALPGLGLSRYKGGPHWIRGAIGYGCVAGSIIMNRAAVNTYNGIIDQAGFDAKNTVYQKSLTQDQVSEVLAYTAVAIWISDLVWTVVGTSDLNVAAYMQRGFRIEPALDPLSHAPLLAITLQF